MSADVRVAVVADAPSLAAVSAALASTPHDGRAPAWFAHAIQANAGLAYVARSDGATLGYLLLQRAAHAAIAADHPLQLWQIYVVPAAHGAGVAAQLMQAALAHARAGRHDVVWLGVSAHNARAIAFYRKHGFAEIGVHEVGSGEHVHRDVLMSRCIANEPE